MTDSRPGRDLRPEIQALRAVAALLVVTYHLWPGRIRGGYIGVDAFFVVSGFLISAHLLREVDARGRIALGAFWARRARRLLPASYLVLAVSAAATYLWIPQLHWRQNFREIIASGVYVQNWRLAADAVDYLASDNAPSTAQHYWTLSVEEQFYLVWPLLILLAVFAARRLRQGSHLAVTLTLGVVTVASFAYSLHLTHADPSAAYFVTPARAWEFGAGALLALLTARAGGTRRAPSRTRMLGASLLSWAGLAALVYGGLELQASTPFPGTAALIPVLGAVAIIAAGAPTGPLSPLPLMRLRPVQLLGDVSYGLYLWHWPPIVVLPYVLGHPMGLWPRIAILVGSVLAAYLTKRFVEDPIRTGTRFQLKRSSVTFGATAVAAAVLVGFCSLGIHQASQAAARTAATTKAYLASNPPCFGAASMDPQKPCHNPDLDDKLVPSPSGVGAQFPVYGHCFDQGSKTSIDACTVGDPTDRSIPRVILVGDSHAQALMPEFAELAEQNKLSVTVIAKSACAWSAKPLTDTDPQRITTCATWRSNLADWLAKHATRRDVIVTTALGRYLDGTHAQIVGGLAEAWDTMARKGIQIVAVKDNPFHDKDPNECLAQLDSYSPSSCAISRSKAFPWFDAMSAAAARVRDAKVLDLTAFYCTTTTCPSIIGGVNVYHDTSHLSYTYARTLAPYLYRELAALGVLRTPDDAG